MTASINDLLPRLQIEVPGANNNLLLFELRKAWRAMCLEADAWRTYQDITLVQNQQTYNLTLPENTEILKLDTVRIITADGLEGYALDELHYELVYGGVPSWKISWLPAGGDVYRVRYVVAPLPSSTDFDMSIIGTYTEAIVAKAAAELMKLPRRKWTNAKRAEDLLVEWRRGKARSRRMELMKKNWTLEIHA